MTSPNPPWLGPIVAQLTSLADRNRMPHALLLHESRGCGGEWLALQTAMLLLCRKREAGNAPCGTCPDCRRVVHREHPDLLWTEPDADKQQLRVDQIRELGAELALTTHGGGARVAVVTPAESMNAAAANALLKSLEEPPPGTVIILVTADASRLPATIRSRCQRIRLPRPDRSTALQWLAQAHGASEDWSAALDLAGGGPFAAACIPADQARAIRQDVIDALQHLQRGEHPGNAAVHWAQADTALYLVALENWLTDRIFSAAGDRPQFSGQGEPAHLQDGVPARNIVELLAVQRELARIRSQLATPINRKMAIEALLWHLAMALQRRTA
ncbi:MAG: DNA polymerase III subunit delta' [Steroidobacteraceae bacterium]